MWEGKSVTASLAMDSTFKSVDDWRVAQSIRSGGRRTNSQTHARRWFPPPVGALKLNVDASLFKGANTFSVGMVLRDHNGEFLAGKNLSFLSPDSVFEAEAIGAKEALSWIKEQGLQNHRILLESDSLMVVRGLTGRVLNLLEVGEVLDQCKILLNELTSTSIHFVRNQANRVAHKIARLPCLVDCQNVFTSLPECLVETVFADASN